MTLTNSPQERLELLLKTMIIQNTNFGAMVAAIAAFNTPELTSFLAPILNDQKRIAQLTIDILKNSAEAEKRTEAQRDEMMKQLDALLEQRPPIGFKPK